MAVYIYSITGKQHPLRLAGLSDVRVPSAGLRTVTAGPVCAVVSVAPEDLRPQRRDIIAHQEVQKRTMADGTGLPTRYGHIADSDEAVPLALEQNIENYSDWLLTLEGRTEYQLKTSQDEDALPRQILRESDVARAGGRSPSPPTQQRR